MLPFFRTWDGSSAATVSHADEEAQRARHDARARLSDAQAPLPVNGFVAFGDEEVEATPEAPRA